MQIKKSDILWLRLAAIDEPGFYPGVPWRMCENAFRRLEKKGLVEKRESETVPGLFSARATDDGRRYIEMVRDYNISRSGGR